MIAFKIESHLKKASFPSEKVNVYVNPQMPVVYVVYSFGVFFFCFHIFIIPLVCFFFVFSKCVSPVDVQFCLADYTFQVLKRPDDFTSSY